MGYDPKTGEYEPYVPNIKLSEQAVKDMLGPKQVCDICKKLSWVGGRMNGKPCCPECVHVNSFGKPKHGSRKLPIDTISPSQENAIRIKEDNNHAEF